MSRNHRYFVVVLLCAFSSSTTALEFSLFGDAQYEVSDDENTFILGSLNLLTSHSISETGSITTDIVFEDEGEGFETHIERFAISKRFADVFEVTAGRFHKPLGFWNNNFHHGSLSQDTVTRPFFLELEGSNEGVFPAHLVGLLTAFETQHLTVQIAASNSTGMNTNGVSEGGDFTATESINYRDPSEDKTYVLRSTFNPPKTRFEIGLFAMLNDIVELGGENPDNLALAERGDTLFEQSVYGIDFSYLGTRFYSFGEYYHINFDDNQSLPSDRVTISTDTYQGEAFYVQVGYRVTSKFTIAMRHASLDYTDGATYFNVQTIPFETRNLAALNYRMEESNALRLEVREENKEPLDSELFYTLQWFFYLL